MTLNGIMAVILRYFSECLAFGVHCAKVVEVVPKLSDRNVAQSF